MTPSTYKQGARLAQRYVIDRYLDEGGMQEVYVAHDGLLDRTVALKVPKNASARRRFHRSAIAAARVNHPSVTRTYDHFNHQDKEHLVEEFVEGLNLQDLSAKVPRLDPYAVAHILHQLSKGLAAVHEQDIVHRDLKPSNIMIEGGLLVTASKITDFGVARMAADEIGDAVSGGAATITASKTAVGAIPYMAPEVIQRPASLSTPADVWALGAICFELLSGAKPFGQGFLAIPKILEAQVPATPNEVQSNPQFRGLGTELMGIILRCLAKEEHLRPTSSDLVRLCERLCYPEIKRSKGVVSNYPAHSFGFISADDGATVFFHVDSVYGLTPKVGDPVWFTRHEGSPRDRAHPVVAMKEAQ